MGWRGRGRYPGYGPFRNIAPWRRPGRLYGYGGYGRGYSYYGDPTKCARFPWLPRWWWANPDYTQSTVPSEGLTAPIYPPSASPEQEKAVLQQELDMISKEMEAIKKRLQELEAGE